VKPANAKELMGQPDVDGALVGGAAWSREVLLTSSKIPFKLYLYELFRRSIDVCIVVNCLMLILLILVQLPKKDAGAAWRSAAARADALFGAGSGMPYQDHEVGDRGVPVCWHCSWVICRTMRQPEQCG